MVCFFPVLATQTIADSTFLVVLVLGLLVGVPTDI